MTDQRESYPEPWVELHDSLEGYLDELRQLGIPDESIEAWLARLRARGMSGEAFVAVCQRASEILRFEAPPGSWTDSPARSRVRRPGLPGDRATADRRG